MARREESEELEVEWLWVPDAYFPHVVVLVGVSSRKDIAGGYDGRKVGQRRGSG